MINKQKMREQALAIRKLLDMEKISIGIVENIKQNTIFKNAKNVLLFYPLKNEVNLKGLLKENNKNFYLPRINGDELDICPFTNEEQLIENKYKIKEPITKPIEDLKLIDLVFVPACLADRECYRLGYGKGFYDRLLPKLKAKTIIPIPEKLVCDKIPKEEHDFSCNLIITEAKNI